MAGLVGICVNHLRPDSIPVVGDWSVKTGMAAATEDNLIIPLSEAAKLFSARAAVFIDARDEQDYESGHIRGALSLPWYNAGKRFPEIAGDIPSGTTIITYCDGKACHLSHDLAVFLRDKGFENVRDLLNGWTVWQDANLPVEEENAVSP
ncbi:MAG: rhodanese-like domain-containing protein [Deltaproteobacteria bacterium]|nr:rhodanese-like domain-containing protein [Deltaproteobacteria bacterium]MBW2649899.1 rhodanese-like domain-containing protein [Deltaproteobacteria bacterium]